MLSSRSSRLARWALIAAPLVMVGCATEVTQHRDWSDYDGPGAEEFRKEELVMWTLPDSGEPTNRTIDSGVQVVSEYVYAPLAWCWRGITTQGIRGGLTNVGQNLLFPVRLVANSLQGNWDGAGTEAERFGINTTIGVLGWTDSAANRGVDAPRKQDMGRTFKSWGWEESNYTALPAATVRDSTGFLPDMFLDPLTYVSPYGLVRRFNDGSDRVDTYVKFTNTTYDPYLFTRLARQLDRELDPTERDYDPGMGGAVDTLQYLFLGLQNKAFADEAEEDEVEIAATGRELGYTYWLHDGPAPIFYVLPGTGGHRNAESSMAYAEMAYRAGYHAVVISSTLNYEFIANAATVDFCGFTPADAADTHDALTAIDAQLREEHGSLIGDQRGLMGISMGAFQTLYIAASENRHAQDDRIAFDGYLALNPPVDLMRAAAGFDRYFNLPLEYFPDQATQHERIKALFRHVIDVAGGGDLRPGKPVPLNNEQSQFLIGVAFRLTLMSILDQARERGVTDDFFLTPRTNKDRTASYRELSRYSFIEYFYAFVLPEQARKRADVENTDEGAATLATLCNLRSLETDLRFNPRIRVVTNRNDVILNPGDVPFLKRVFGTNLMLHDVGGHLGNLWKPEVQKQIMDDMRRVVPVSRRSSD